MNSFYAYLLRLLIRLIIGRLQRFLDIRDKSKFGVRAMKIYETALDGRQYAKLEKMLVTDRAKNLAMNKPINGYELFSDMLDDLYAPITEGWSTLEIVLSESSDKLKLLRFMTKQVFYDDENYFVRQLGGHLVFC